MQLIEWSDSDAEKIEWVNCGNGLDDVVRKSWIWGSRCQTLLWQDFLLDQNLKAFVEELGLSIVVDS